jgi:hypothetical protein
VAVPELVTVGEAFEDLIFHFPSKPFVVLNGAFTIPPVTTP